MLRACLPIIHLRMQIRMPGYLFMLKSKLINSKWIHYIQKKNKQLRKIRCMVKSIFRQNNQAKFT